MALTDSDGKKNKKYGNDKAALKAKAERVLVAEGNIQFNKLEEKILKDAGYNPSEVSKWKDKKDVESLIRSIKPTFPQS